MHSAFRLYHTDCQSGLALFTMPIDPPISKRNLNWAAQPGRHKKLLKPCLGPLASLPAPCYQPSSSFTPDSSGVVSFGGTQIHRAPTGA